MILLRWFDYWLKGYETGILQMPGALLQDQKGNWHGEDALVPSRAETTALFPSTEGRLVDNGPAAGSASFVDYGEGVDPRGTCVYVAGGILVGCAPVHQPTAVSFTSEPYAEQTRFSGIAKMHLTLKHSVPRGTIGVTLFDVDGGTWTPMTYGIASFNVRNGDYAYEPVDPGVPFEQTVELLARDFVLEAGHRLGVVVGAQIARNPKGLSGNGFGPVPSGGITDVLFGPSTWLEIGMLPDSTPILPLL